MRVVVRYKHRPADIGTVYLAVVHSKMMVGGRVLPARREGPYPAYRDTIDGEHVVWVRVREPLTRASIVELSDEAGTRVVAREDIRS